MRKTINDNLFQTFAKGTNFYLLLMIWKVIASLLFFALVALKSSMCSADTKRIPLGSGL